MSPKLNLEYRDAGSYGKEVSETGTIDPCDNPSLTKVEERIARAPEIRAETRRDRRRREGCNFEEEDHARLILRCFQLDR